MNLPTSYFAPILQFALINLNEEYQLEAKEHFVKQTYRSRCEIYGANGKLALVVPLKKWRNHTPINEIEISYDEAWQNLHWRSIESAYRASPYFEFYEEDLKPLFFLETALLLERNQILEDSMKEIIGITASTVLTSKYETQQNDWRKKIHPKNKSEELGVNFPKYIQVFEEKHGFIPNLSILDLLFNLGPNCKTYLEKLSIN